LNAAPNPAATAQPVFYYDLGDPECYLLAERILTALDVPGARVPEFEPVLAADLLVAPAEADRRGLERRALELEIQPLRWPPVWPPDTREAMLAATYAKRIGRVVAFSLAAFRQAFAGGRDLADRDTILIAGAACEMHPSALQKGIALRSTGEALGAAAERARLAGVGALPAIQVDDRAFAGADALARAADALKVRA
jgi:2-hydroxychromene-2-carboxylate isomerase